MGKLRVHHLFGPGNGQGYAAVYVESGKGVTVYQLLTMRQLIALAANRGQ